MYEYSQQGPSKEEERRKQISKPQDRLQGNPSDPDRTHGILKKGESDDYSESGVV